MIVVSDTSPVNYLLLIGCQELLKNLFSKIALPAAVLTELQSEHAPAQIREWLGRRPEWVEVRQVELPQDFLRDLGPGEREAIYLAKDLGADELLMDDAKGRVAAEHVNLHVVGTIGILDAAALRGFVDLPAAVEKLKQTTFRAKPGLLDSLLKKHLG